MSEIETSPNEETSPIRINKKEFLEHYAPWVREVFVNAKEFEIFIQPKSVVFKCLDVDLVKTIPDAVL